MDMTRVCSNCKYNYGTFTCDEKDKNVHCYKCHGFNMFLSKDKEYPKHKCIDCFHYKTGPNEEPCSMCVDYSLYEGRVEKRKRKMCADCKHSKKAGWEEPCASCFKKDKWEEPSAPSQSENEGEVVTIPNSDVVIVDDVSEVSPAGNGAENLKETISNAVNNFHFSLDPCKMCKYESDESTCKTCCYFYASEFELKEMK